MVITQGSAISLQNNITEKYAHRSKAFTLIELLVVVAIIVVLIAILLPSLGQARDQAKRVQCAAILRGTGTATLTYAGEFEGNFPFGSLSNYPSCARSYDPPFSGTWINHKSNYFWGNLLLAYTGNKSRNFYCPIFLEAWNTVQERYITPWNDESVFAFNDMFQTTYFYFANFPMDVQLGGTPISWHYRTSEEVQQAADGLLYPKKTNSPRAKLGQDLITNSYIFPYQSAPRDNHPYPNSLFSDGSVEAGPKDVRNVASKEYMVRVRPNGYTYYW